MITLKYYEMNDNDFISLIYEKNIEDFLPSPLSCDDEIVIYRGNGYKRNKSIINKIQEIIKSLEIKERDNINCTIYTNDEELLSLLHYECFDRKIQRFSIYINDVWIHDLYENIRLENNILKMYKSGVLNERK